MLVRSVAPRLRALFATMVAAALVLALAVPLTAVATPLASIDVTLLVTSQGTGNPLLLVAGHLPERTALPAELVLPVPEGAVLEWSGEILGDIPEEDQEAPATIEVRDGVNVAVLSMSQSRIGQVEVSFPGATAPAGDDGFTAGFALTAPSNAEMVRVAIGLAPGAQQAVELPDGVLSAEGPQGEIYYYQDLGAVSTGDPIELSMQYRETGAPAAGGMGSPQSASAEVPPLVIVLVAAVFAGAVLMVLASRARAKGAAEESETDDVIVDDSDGESAAAAEDARGAEYALSETDSDEESEFESEPGSEFEPGSETEQAAPSSSGWLTPQRLVIIAGVLVVGIAAAVILGGQQGQVGVTESADGWITQRISTASGDSTVDLNVQISCECPPEEEAPKIFEVLRQVPGVAYAELEAATLLMRVQYDPALTDEAAIALALRGAGYLP